MKDFRTMMLLTGGNRFAAQNLWLRKVRSHMEAPQGAGASAPKAAQQVAGCKPKPAPARAQAVPKPRTAAQIGRRERSQKQLRQKHLARKMWASVRIASKLLAWRCRARYNGILASQLRYFRANIFLLLQERGCPLLTSVVALVRGCPPWTMEEGGGGPGGRQLAADESARVRASRLARFPASLPPALALVARPPATQLVPPPPPSQPPPSALAAAARAALDACEMQDNRGSKRDALARTPPRPTAAPTLPPLRRATREDGTQRARVCVRRRHPTLRRAAATHRHHLH